ncbi:metallophosphoesterase family protein [Halomarina oriensis]|uniref:Phosphoesterase n=1 Tax=Halomarina oriensis TaxID=671145 RepID=A0A6B0GTB7_9EURY|nr:metallophosphoesterase family protein [Halomarina oriensis]MWG36929.1 YfcE family phosphodiesterase [Halomarina oriensis]
MRIGLVSDLHANAVAFTAVREALADAGPLDGLVCAGDVVGYNPFPSECVEALRSGAAAREVGADRTDVVQGNHDRAVESPERYRHNEMAFAGLRCARERLDDEQLAWLADLPVETHLADGRVRVVHDHPTDRDRYVRPPEFGALAPHLGDETVLVLGHTHVQHAEWVEDTLVVNPGSVGQPRDGDPRAAFAVLDLPDEGHPSVTEHRVAYDVERVRAAVDAAGLPERTGRRLARGE